MDDVRVNKKVYSVARTLERDTLQLSVEVLYLGNILESFMKLNRQLSEMLHRTNEGNKFDRLIIDFLALYENIDAQTEGLKEKTKKLIEVIERGDIEIDELKRTDTTSANVATH
ncbi:hypothetical protein [Metasolibacillus meyeri]|uniref:hypothetical protein n=1 Tax=Metasolibacillus meyeri TaxID=1071052 RepID=UPI000D31D626|nr:hypothetical protein [Metasolibacillus meyeri]